MVMTAVEGGSIETQQNANPTGPINSESIDKYLSDLKGSMSVQDDSGDVSEDQDTQTPKEGEVLNSQDGSSTDTGDDDTPRYSRRELAKEVERLMKENQSLSQKNQEFQSSQARTAQEELELQKEVLRIIGGTDTELEQLEEEALRTRNPELMDKLAQFKSNRKFYGKLQSVAQKQIIQYFTSQFIDLAKNLEGLDQKTLLEGTPPQVVQHAYESAVRVTESKYKEQIAKLEAELTEAKSKVVSTGLRAPLPGGKSGTGVLFDQLFDEKGALTDEAVSLARSGQLRGLQLR